MELDSIQLLSLRFALLLFEADNLPKDEIGLKLLHGFFSGWHAWLTIVCAFRGLLGLSFEGLVILSRFSRVQLRLAITL